MKAVQFEHVSKWYPRYNYTLNGFKHSILHPFDTIRSFRHERFIALDDVSFEINRGEAIGLIGANGSGKSTTLALMAGVSTPHAGQITTQGRICPLLDLGSGFHLDLSGKDNIVLNGVILGLTLREMQERLGAIMAFSELGDFLEQPIRTYSNGMIARLGFSIAVHLDPEILLIDEVLSVGDLQFQLKCNDKFDEFKRRQVTMVIVSHSLEQIQRLCDRVIWLEKGRVVDEGAPALILPRYAEAAGSNQAVM